ncbi:MAG: SAM-dependent methyltransferase [Alphaproteobacteria bacterium PA4]|nr:MAG: SAM-dependent methyltransferase [Alphaproteobacteria bacterium PA4]
MRLRLLPLLLLLAAPALAFPLPQRQVARVVSPVWADEDSRDKAGEAASVIRQLGIKPGQTVADIGAGSGYYTMRVAPIVGPKGQVIAQDIVQRYLDDLKARTQKAGLTNVRFVKGSTSDPRLPRASVDVALLIHMYHEIAQPYALLYNLRASLKPDARIAIVDLERAAEYHGMPKELLVCEVKAVGYDLVSIADLKPGYLAVFKPGTPVNPATVKACRG